MTRKNTVNFSEIFNFAQKNSGVEWNDANNLFFNTILTYKGSNEFWREELEWALKEDYLEENNDRKARQIMLAFMKENKVKTLLVLND